MPSSVVVPFSPAVLPRKAVPEAPAAASALVLACDENPQGWPLAELLYRLQAELEIGMNRAAFRSVAEASAAITRHRHLLAHLREAEVLARAIDIAAGASE